MAETDYTTMAQAGLLVSAGRSALAAGPVAGSSLPTAYDQYFLGEPGLVSTFDFDYDAIIDFSKKLRWALLIFCPPAALASSVCCYPCFLNQNVEWEARARHVALTVDGIRYVTEKRRSLCGLPCTDRGKASKTVPYDKITDCDVQEPAGMACCCCVQRVLTVVKVDTASSGGLRKDGRPTHELTLQGLRFPTEFKQAVWGMKRSQEHRGQSSHVAAAPQQHSMEAALLEIRDELKKISATMAAKAGQESVSQP